MGERGPHPAFLASCLSRCSVPFRSQPKLISFHSGGSFVVEILDGLGVITRGDEYDQVPDPEYDDLFEVCDGEATDCSFPEAVDAGIKVWKHLKNAIEMLYSAPIDHLETAFAVVASGTSFELDLADIFGCKIASRAHFRLFQRVPDGIDLFAALVALWSTSDLTECMCGCPASVSLAVRSVAKFRISELFFDCDIQSIASLMENQMRKINPRVLDSSMGMCDNCYWLHQQFERRRRGLEAPDQCRGPTMVESPVKVRERSQRRMPGVVKRLLEPEKPRIGISVNFGRMLDKSLVRNNPGRASMASRLSFA